MADPQSMKSARSATAITQAEDYSSLARKMSETSLDSDGFIKSLGASITYYKWDPASTAQLTYEQLQIAGGGERGRSDIYGETDRTSAIPIGAPSSAAIVESLGKGAVGIFKENIEAFARQNDTSLPLGGPAGQQQLYSTVDVDNIPLKVFNDSSVEGISNSSVQMTMELEYSPDEEMAIDAKYGYLPSPETSRTQIDNTCSAMALDLLQTFTNHRLTQNKAYKKTRLKYKDIVSLTNKELVSMVDISTIASTEITEASDRSAGFNYSSTLATDY
jgi:hypothetical protein